MKQFLKIFLVIAMLVPMASCTSCGGGGGSPAPTAIVTYGIADTGGGIAKVMMDYPETGKITIRGQNNSGAVDMELSYTNVGDLYTMTMSQGGTTYTFYARIAHGFIVINASSATSTTAAYGIQIDPDLTNMDYVKGKNYGALMTDFTSSFPVKYMKEEVSSTGVATLGLAATVGGGFQSLVDLNIADYVFNTDYNYFSQTYSGDSLATYSNVDGYSVSLDQTADQISFVNETPATNDIPSGITALSTYKGYFYCEKNGPAEVVDATVTVDAVSTTSFSVTVESVGGALCAGTSPSLPFTAVVAADWPNGFYNYVGQPVVARLLGSNAILFSSSSSASDYQFGLVIKQ